MFRCIFVKFYDRLILWIVSYHSLRNVFMIVFNLKQKHTEKPKQIKTKPEIPHNEPLDTFKYPASSIAGCSVWRQGLCHRASGAPLRKMMREDGCATANIRYHG